jgi:hypothetical protein
MKPSSLELDHTEALFRRTLVTLPTISNIDELAASWLALGYKLDQFTAPTGDLLWLVRTEATNSNGQGFYIINKSTNAKPIGLQIPHGDSDLKTEEIGVRLCLEHSFLTCAWNTIHRRVFDVAHTADSTFQRFIKAQLTENSEILFAQIHGFDATKRRSQAGRQASLIMSDGTEHSKHLASAVELLSKHDPGLTTMLYGRDVKELGATTNAQAKLIRDLSDGKFVHIEMNHKERSQMVSNAERRRALYDALTTLTKADPTRDRVKDSRLWQN